MPEKDWIKITVNKARAKIVTCAGASTATEVVPKFVTWKLRFASHLELAHSFTILTSQVVTNQGWQVKVIGLLLDGLPLLATLTSVRILLHPSTRVDVPQNFRLKVNLHPHRSQETFVRAIQGLAGKGKDVSFSVNKIFAQTTISRPVITDSFVHQILTCFAAFINVSESVHLTFKLNAAQDIVLGAFDLCIGEVDDTLRT